MTMGGDERDVELVARVLHREHEENIGRDHRPWVAESDIYRDGFRNSARRYIAAVRTEATAREESHEL